MGKIAASFLLKLFITLVMKDATLLVSPIALAELCKMSNVNNIIVTIFDPRGPEKCNFAKTQLS